MAKRLSTIISINALSFSLIAGAELKGAEEEQQPWSQYKVHDEQREHPQKIEGAHCVSTPAPVDAIVLFGQGGADAFTEPWRVEDGVMIASAQGSTKTKQAFGSCHLHVEWRVPAGRKVSGQKGGNSGIFLMSRYEIQIQESHTNVTYADGQAAAIYGQTPPQWNASLPQGEWQSYDILFEAPEYDSKGMVKPAYVTVIHNGIVVHARQKIYGPTMHKKATSYPENHPEKEVLILQWHSDPIEYRNLWIKELNEE